MDRKTQGMAPDGLNSVNSDANEHSSCYCAVALPDGFRDCLRWPDGKSPRARHMTAFG